MLFLMLASDVLRMKKLELHRVPAQPDMISDESSAESLAKLILFRDSPLNQSRADKWDLSRVQMELKPTKHSCYYQNMGSLDRRLNLNIRDTKIDLHGLYSDFIFPAAMYRITADKTEKLTVTFRTRSPNPLQDLLNFPREQLRAFLRYLLDCCPNAKEIYVVFHVDNALADAQFEPYAVWILAFNQFTSETLTDIETGDCKMILNNIAEFQTSKLNEAEASGHAISKLGASIHKIPNVVIARKTKLSEKIYTAFDLFGTG